MEVGALREERPLQVGHPQANPGVMLDAEGPSHLEGISFMNFKSNDLRRAAAIEWRDGYM